MKHYNKYKSYKDIDPNEIGWWQGWWFKTTGGRGLYYPYRKNGDCVNRALALASEKNYKEVFEGLLEVAIPLGLPINDEKVYTRYLKKNEYVWVYTGTMRNGKKPRAKDISAFVEKDVWQIASQANHLVAVKNGYVYDTWDSSERMVYGFYVKKENKKF